jgi:hypothetical protein
MLGKDEARWWWLPLLRKNELPPVEQDLEGET